jgi:putative heme-binding domain-containing protein
MNIKLPVLICCISFVYCFTELKADVAYKPTSNANILPFRQSLDQTSWENQNFSISKLNQNIIFLGGTDTVEQDFNGYLETLLTLELAEYQPKFLNFSWQADTVYKQQRPRYFYSKNKFNEGIADQRKKFRADIVFLRYGKMESFDRLPKLREFADAYRQMIQNIKTFTKRIVVMTPYPFESSGSLSSTAANRNQVLENYVKIIHEIALEEGALVINLFDTLRDIFSTPVKSLTRDGLQLNDHGHWLLAQEIMRQLNINNNLKKAHVTRDPADGLLWPADREDLRQRIIHKNGLLFKYFRPTNWAFLFGNRQQTPSSWYHYDGGGRWFPQEVQNLLSMIEKAEHEIYSLLDQGNSVESELNDLIVDDRFEINIFADEKLGIANPIAMNWDPMGRLWVLCTSAYPQLKPGAKGNDKLFILEDRDKDGKAESSKVFADNLEMPTGFAIGNGGAYIGQGTQLIHLKDLDGDGKSDSKRIIFTGFGTDDTHQNINSFTWSPDGYLYFCQGMHAFSRIETPWGISMADESAVWRLHLETLKLQSYMSPNMSADNPWGIAFGKWGQMYLKGNDQQIYDVAPAMIPTKNYSRMEDGYGLMGRTKAKSMALEIVETSHLPEDFQGCFLIAGYFDRSIERFRVERNGSVSKAVRLKKFIVGKHPAFRPVDVKIGPDGAIYIADWFNLIINHYQESLRHPKRDKLHGRIWRAQYKRKPLVTTHNLSSLPLGKLFNKLKHKESWVRYQTRRLISELPRKTVKKELETWLSGLDQEESEYAHHIYEAISICQIHQIYRFDLLNVLQKSKDFNARAYAASIIEQWHSKMDNPLEKLAELIADPDPRVRLKAVGALSHIQSPQSIKIALHALDSKVDLALEYALKQSVHALEPFWLPELEKGGDVFDGNIKHAAFALATLGSEKTSSIVRNLLETKDNSDAIRNRLLILLSHIGNANELLDLLGKAKDIPGLMDELVIASKKRTLRPPQEAVSYLESYLNSENDYFRINAVRLTGQWGFTKLADTISEMILKKEASTILTVAGINALNQLHTNGKTKLYQKLVSHQDVKVRHAAALALCRTDLDIGIPVVAGFLSEPGGLHRVDDLIKPLLEIDGATKKLAFLLHDQPVKPKTAEAIVQIMNQKGWDDPELQHVLTKIIGRDSGRVLYSSSYVIKLIEDSQLNGDVKRGRKVFHSPVTACFACHQIDGKGGVLGPDLTTVSSGISPELLVESIIWPERQIKEGYAATRITTNTGNVFQGYLVRNNKPNGFIKLREPSSGEIRSIPGNKIVDRSESISLMPKGLTRLLSPEELRDLVKYLLECR